MRKRAITNMRSKRRKPPLKLMRSLRSMPWSTISTQIRFHGSLLPSMSSTFSSYLSYSKCSRETASWVWQWPAWQSTSLITPIQSRDRLSAVSSHWLPFRGSTTSSSFSSLTRVPLMRTRKMAVTNTSFVDSFDWWLISLSASRSL